MPWLLSFRFAAAHCRIFLLVAQRASEQRTDEPEREREDVQKGILLLCLICSLGFTLLRTPASTPHPHPSPSSISFSLTRSPIADSLTQIAFPPSDLELIAQDHGSRNLLALLCSEELLDDA